MPAIFAPDPRVTLARPDLAELALEGVLAAAAYRAPQAMQCLVPASAVRAGAEETAPLIDELAFGEVFDVLEVSGDWAWGRARRDGVVGYAARRDLTDEILEPTHRVASADALAGRGLEQEGGVGLPLNALVTVLETSGDFARTARAGWMVLTDLADFHAFDAEPAAVAERFMGAPYLRGGRNRWGRAAAALIQQALYACGRACPREADQQQALGRAAAPEGLIRSDLVFWGGHVAMMLDAERLIHADPAAGVTVQTLAQASESRGGPDAVRRL